MIVILSWFDGDKEKPELEFFPDGYDMAANVALYLSKRPVGQSVAIYDLSSTEDEPDVIKPIS